MEQKENLMKYSEPVIIETIACYIAKVQALKTDEEYCIIGTVGIDDEEDLKTAWSPWGKCKTSNANFDIPPNIPEMDDIRRHLEAINPPPLG